jgi:katanin p80 WD40 repeat-containing subunit B1
MREERIQKCDKVIEQLRQIVQMPKLQKIIDRNKEEISLLAKSLQSDLLVFLKRSASNQIT